MKNVKRVTLCCLLVLCLLVLVGCKKKAGTEGMAPVGEIETESVDSNNQGEQRLS